MSEKRVSEETRRAIGDAPLDRSQPDHIPLKPPQVPTGPLDDAVAREVDESLAESSGLPGTATKFVKDTSGVPTATPGVSTVTHQHTPQTAYDPPE